MADISIIKTPNNATYNIKDATARTSISNLEATSSTTGTQGTTSSVKNADTARCIVKKHGKRVICYVGIGYNNGTSTIGSNVTLFTIPSGYRPSSQQVFPAMAYLSSGKAVVALLRFNANGTIIQTTASSVTAIYGVGEWQVS